MRRPIARMGGTAMSARATLFRKDLRLAAGIAVPALAVLAAVCGIVLFGHHLPEVGRELWGYRGEPPSMSERIAAFHPVLFWALYIMAVWSAVVVSLGDRMRRAELLACAVPASDASKVFSKYAAMMSVAIAFAVLLAINNSLGETPFRGPLDRIGVWYMLAPAPILGALCGFAAAGLVRNTTAAVLLGLALPMVGVPLGWLAGWLFVRLGSAEAVARLWREDAFPYWLLDSLREVVFAWATMVAAIVLVFLIAVFRTQGLASRTPRSRGWRTLAGATVAAGIAACVTAAVVVEQDGRLEILRRSILAREEARQAAATLDADELLVRLLGIPHRQQGAARSETDERDLLRAFVLYGVTWSELRNGGYLQESSNEQWVGENHFVREPYRVELRSRHIQRGNAFLNAGQQAVRMLITDESWPLMTRISLAAISGLGRPIPDRAAALLAARNEFERAVAIIAIAALGQCGEVAIAVRESLNWEDARDCARRVLESVLPGAATDDRAVALRFGSVTSEDEELVRKALLLVDQPLPAVAAEIELMQRERQKLKTESSMPFPIVPRLRDE